MSDKFCYLPWVFNQLSTNGTHHACPSIADDVEPRSFDKDFRCLANSEARSDMRRQMLCGQLPKSCSSCRQVEDGGGTSLRMALNRSLERIVNKDELRTATSSAGAISDPKLKYLELRLDRGCNLKCRFCSPRNSNQWDADYSFLYGEAELEKLAATGRYNEDWITSPAFQNWLERHFSEIEILQFAGGEPLINPIHARILERVIELRLAKQMTLIYTTNLTVLPDRIFDLWRQFKNVQLYVSVEATADLYEYLRYPASWSRLEKNLLACAGEIGKSIHKVVIQPHINILNFGGLATFGRWLCGLPEEVQINSHMNFLLEPDWLSVFVLPTDKKRQIAHRILSEISVTLFEASPRNMSVKSWIKKVADVALSKDESRHWERCLKMNQMLDQARGQQGMTSKIFGL